MKKLVFFLLLFSVNLRAQNVRDLKQVEDLLDSLEDKLLERERNRLFNDKVPESGSVLESYDYFDRPLEVEAKSDLSSDIDQITLSLAEIDEEISALDSELKSINDRLNLQSSIDNYIQINVRKSVDLEFRFLSVELNGYELYAMPSESSMWIPNPELALFEGPLSPGDYTIKLQARATPNGHDLSEKMKKLQVYKQEKSFKVTKTTKKIDISIFFETPEQQNLNAEAKITIDEK